MIECKKIKAQIAPYTDVLRFIFVLLVGNAVWKMVCKGDEAGNYVTCLGYDVTGFFSWASAHVARMSFYVVHFFEEATRLVYGNIIIFPNDVQISIVWGCSAVKQASLFTLIMLFSRGSWVNKLWFVPLGWLAVYLFNILRISIIALLIQHHPTWFEFLHSYLFKYLFYGMIFALWVVWIERLSQLSSKKSC